MSSRRLLAGCAAALVGCSDEVPPELLGTFSSREEIGMTGLGYSMHLTRFMIAPDGTGVRTRLGSCDTSVLEDPFTWEARDGAVVITNPRAALGTDLGVDEVRLVLTDECTPYGFQQVRLEEVRAGAVASDTRLTRGSVCLESYSDDSCPEGDECDDCKIAWCDEPSEPCQD
jgi:hypothetical protein